MGLWQAAYLWNREFDKKAREMGFLSLLEDMFIYTNGQNRIIIVYVEDINQVPWLMGQPFGWPSW
jgi:hypothetical protein